MEDWWENWFSDLDMNGDNSSLKLNECEMNSCSNNKTRATEGRKRVRSCWEIQDHIMAERKRRHEMAERFVALSSIIPGLKKIDKASVLGEAISYVKQLKGRIAILEQQSNNNSKRTKCTKSIISFTKSQSHPPNINHHHNLDSNQVLPQIEAICIESEKELMFIRIQCEKCKGIFFKLLLILQNMHLSLSSSSVLPFGKNTLNIAIIAKMGEEYKITGEELVKKLRQDLMELYEIQHHVIHASVSKEL